MSTEQDRLELYLAKMRLTIQEYGVALQGVMDDPPFTYTVGLTDVRHPELIIFGLPHEFSAVVLNHLSNRIRSGVLKFKDGDEFLDEDVCRVPLKFLAVAEVNYPLYIQQAINIYPPTLDAPSPVRCLQLVWPDAEGAYPWDDAWRLGAMQPVLAFPDPKAVTL